MIKESLRLIAIILLVIIIIMDDFPFYQKLKHPSTQLFMAILIVAFIFYDTTFGFIMGVVLLIIYYEIYKKIIMSHEKQLAEKMSENKQSNESQAYHQTKLDYLSADHLLAAQNNIVDVTNMNTEVKGFDDGYGAQGIGMGYDKYDTYHLFT